MNKDFGRNAIAHHNSVQITDFAHHIHLWFGHSPIAYEWNPAAFLRWNRRIFPPIITLNDQPQAVLGAYFPFQRCNACEPFCFVRNCERQRKWTFWLNVKYLISFLIKNAFTLPFSYQLFHTIQIMTQIHSFKLLKEKKAPQIVNKKKNQKLHRYKSIISKNFYIVYGLFAYSFQMLKWAWRKHIKIDEEMQAKWKNGSKSHQLQIDSMLLAKFRHRTWNNSIFFRGAAFFFLFSLSIGISNGPCSFYCTPHRNAIIYIYHKIA